MQADEPKDNMTFIEEFELNPDLLNSKTEKYINEEKVKKLKELSNLQAGTIGPVKSKAKDSGSLLAHQHPQSLQMWFGRTYPQQSFTKRASCIKTSST